MNAFRYFYEVKNTPILEVYLPEVHILIIMVNWKAEIHVIDESPHDNIFFNAKQVIDRLKTKGEEFDFPSRFNLVSYVMSLLCPNWHNQISQKDHDRMNDAIFKYADPQRYHVVKTREEIAADPHAFAEKHGYTKKSEH